MESGVRAGRIRAFRSEEAEAEVERRRAALALLFTQPQEIERALRDARRAGRAGARHYDPARHAALIRLWRAARRKAAAGGPGGRRPAQEGRPADGPARDAVEKGRDPRP
ncbi:hypothetical protein [Xanthobacter sediminis]